jgi:hypothetical protein
MHVRILDLDGSVTEQRKLVWHADALVFNLREWGPRVRMGCSLPAFRRFEKALSSRCIQQAAGPVLTFYGSGDFHHITLALLRRLRRPFNLLVLDKHPDWMRGIPMMHCGTWLNHALRSANIRRVFHLGGDLDFDNAFRLLAPWGRLRSGTVTVIPAVRPFTRGRWKELPNRPLRAAVDEPVTSARLDELCAGARSDLARYPLYITLDKDVMSVSDAIVNWDSGYLQLSEVQCLLNWFLSACGGRLAGMDILGDWSPVRVRGLVRRLLHWTEHPRLRVDPVEARELNSQTNIVLVETLRAALPLAA